MEGLLLCLILATVYGIWRLVGKLEMKVSSLRVKKILEDRRS